MEDCVLIKSQKLRQFINDILLAEGVNSEEASIISTVFVWFDLIGRHNQGVGRLPDYLVRFRKNLIKSPCKPVFTQKSATISLVDGQDGFGHYLGHISMLRAIEIAEQYGVGLVGVSHSNHYGAGAYYAQLAAQRLQIGLALSNSFPRVAPYGGLTAVLGTNPFAFSAPTKSGHSIIADFSTGANAGSTIRKAIKDNQSIPEGILMNEQGDSIIEPQQAGDGVIAPFGGAKGFCLGLMVEILSGVITEAGISHEIASMYKNFERSANIGHFFLTIDISKIMTLESYYERVERMISFVKSATPSISGGAIMIPGENRWRNYYQQVERGIKLKLETIDTLNSLARSLKISNRI